MHFSIFTTAWLHFLSLQSLGGFAHLDVSAKSTKDSLDLASLCLTAVHSSSNVFYTSCNKTGLTYRRLSFKNPGPLSLACSPLPGISGMGKALLTALSDESPHLSRETWNADSIVWSFFFIKWINYFELFWFVEKMCWKKHHSYIQCSGLYLWGMLFSHRCHCGTGSSEILPKGPITLSELRFLSKFCLSPPRIWIGTMTSKAEISFQRWSIST